MFLLSLKHFLISMRLLTGLQVKLRHEPRMGQLLQRFHLELLGDAHEPGVQGQHQYSFTRLLVFEVGLLVFVGEEERVL